MRTLDRKPGKYGQVKPDPLVTQTKFDELARKLERLKASHPAAAEEVRRLAEMGDFSENYAYQAAKAKLRSINSSILKLERQLADAEIIRTTGQTDTVEIGHTVTIDTGSAVRTYQILGSSETNPDKGIISHTSPIGSALLGHKVGDTVKVKLKNGEVEYQIVAIE